MRPPPLYGLRCSFRTVSDMRPQGAGRADRYTISVCLRTEVCTQKITCWMDMNVTALTRCAARARRRYVHLCCRLSRTAPWGHKGLLQHRSVCNVQRLYRETLRCVAKTPFSATATRCNMLHVVAPRCSTTPGHTVSLAGSRCPQPSNPRALGQCAAAACPVTPPWRA